MLRLFAATPGRVLGKRELLNAIWPNVNVGDDSLFQCVRELRTALGDEQRQMIKLVSSRGYIFEVEVSAQSPVVMAFAADETGVKLSGNAQATITSRAHAAPAVT